MKEQNTGVNINANLEPVLTATPTGIRYIFNMLFGKKHAAAERMLKLADAQNYNDIKKIMSGTAFYDHKNQELVESNNQNVKEIIVEKIQNEEISNLLKCSAHAAICLDDRVLTDAPGIPDSFVHRWRSEAKLISDETAQAIWGRILAEEAHTPNSVSLRTLDTIKNLSKQEAENFNEACTYVAFDRYIIDHEKDSTTSAPSDAFNLLRDAGLIANYTPGYYKTSEWPETKITMHDGSTVDTYYLKCGQLFLFIDNKDANPSNPINRIAPTFVYWELTSAGRELYKIINKTLEIDLENLKYRLSKNIKALADKIKYTPYLDSDKHQIDTTKIKPL